MPFAGRREFCKQKTLKNPALCSAKKYIETSTVFVDRCMCMHAYPWEACAWYVAGYVCGLSPSIDPTSWIVAKQFPQLDQAEADSYIAIKPMTVVEKKLRQPDIWIPSESLLIKNTIRIPLSKPFSDGP